MNNNEEEYSIALFEDGTKEMIPKSWIQDYLKEENTESDMEMQYETLRDKPSSSNINPQRNIVLSTQYYESTRKILQILVKEVSENKTAILKLQKGVDRLLCVALGEPEPEVNLSQPAETLNEFLALEEHVKIKQNFDEIVCNLSKIGGKTVESTTRKIWSKLCTTQLASTICWTGANGKYCLKPLILNRLVRDAVLLTHPQGKESEIQKATMLWFSHAQDRLRARRSFHTEN
ncbi:hypothetical protein MML48_4g00010509 [Holotrichia oblita]|uniref:Uncharacterized protein n=1 Tax=Holotrichia oblita TaxID=644536 RepID=A0ACB9TBF5_HOLOL|nr:hypothetical protein MML48_4g00010509 [Holotrichia oblita]